MEASDTKKKAPAKKAPPKAAPDAAPEHDPKAEARARAEACGRAVEELLVQHGCRIAAFLTYESVGNMGERAIIGASYGIVVADAEPSA